METAYIVQGMRKDIQKMSNELSGTKFLKLYDTRYVNKLEIDIEELKQQLTWCDASKELPNIDEHVIVKDLKGSLRIGHCRKDRGKYIFICSRGYILDRYNVQSWLPIPKE